MRMYTALIEKGVDCFGVSFPDFPGCITSCDEFSEIPFVAKEVLEFHIEGMLEDGLDIPTPSTFKDSLNDIDDSMFDFLIWVGIDINKTAQL